MIRVALVAIAIAATLTACARAPASRTSPLSLEAGVPIDNELMAYLSLARARHHEANLEEDHDLPAAIASLTALVSAPCPHPGSKVPEIDEVLADTFARLAELQLRADDLAGATESVHQGLLHAPDASYFRGHLLEVGGLVEETREGSLQDAGATAAAASARQKALDLFHQAVLVQEAVVKESLHADDGSTRGGK